MSPRAEGIEVCVLALYMCTRVPLLGIPQLSKGGNGKIYRCKMLKGWSAATGRGAVRKVGLDGR